MRLISWTHPHGSEHYVHEIARKYLGEKKYSSCFCNSVAGPIETQHCYYVQKERIIGSTPSIEANEMLSEMFWHNSYSFISNYMQSLSRGKVIYNC
jgi:hypothetical protein